MDAMNKTKFSLILLGTLALVGCGQQATPDAAISATMPSTPTISSSPTSAPTAFTVSEKATCTLLIGPKEDGPLIQYINGVSSFDASNHAAIVKTAEARDSVKDIAKSAGSEMKVLLTALFSDDVNQFKASGVELLTRCS
jgi:hypothetical protein